MLKLRIPNYEFRIINWYHCGILNRKSKPSCVFLIRKSPCNMTLIPTIKLYALFGMSIIDASVFTVVPSGKKKSIYAVSTSSVLPPATSHCVFPVGLKPISYAASFDRAQILAPVSQSAETSTRSVLPCFCMCAFVMICGAFLSNVHNAAIECTRGFSIFPACRMPSLSIFHPALTMRNAELRIPNSQLSYFAYPFA